MGHVKRISLGRVDSVMGTRSSALGLLLCALLSQGAFADESFPISYSGRLTQASGAPLEGTLDIEASFWSDATDGTRLGGFTKTAVTLANGVFSLQLPLAGGEVASIFKDGSSPVYIEINAGGKKYPRQLYMYTPLALRIPVDDRHLVYDDTTGKLRIKMDQSATDGSVLTSDGRGGLTWKKIEAAQIVAKDASGAAPTTNQVLTYDGTQWVAAPMDRASNALTGVTGVEPITVTGSGTVPSIAIAQASGTAAGYLSSADWTNFNSKQSALGFTPVNKSGDTLSGTLNLGSNDMVSTGNLSMSVSKVLGISNNPTDPSVSGAGDKGKLWFNSTSNELKYWDGSMIKTLGTAGSGLQSFNGQTGNSQTLATPGTTGTAPTWSSGAGVHTLNIPVASAAGVTAGLISNADYSAFNGKISSVSAGTGVNVSASGTTATVGLAATSVTPGSYTRANITVDAQGRLTGAVNSLPLVDADIAVSAGIAQTKISGLASDLASKEPSIAPGTSTQYWSGTKTWQALNTSAVPEGSNQYFTPARAISALSSAAPITYSNVTGTIGISQASGSGNGYLSSSDWSTFNGKQNALGFNPLNKAGDTLTGPLDANGQDVTNAGNLVMASAKVLGLSKNPSDPSLTGAADKGKLWFNSTTNELRYWDGSAIKTLGTAGSGLQSFNGQTANSQTLAVPGTTGTAPNWASSAGAHTLHIPMASAAGVTAGLISAADYTAFNGKVASITAGVGVDVATSGTTASVALSTTAVIPGSYTRANITVDAQGRLTGAQNAAAIVDSDISLAANIAQSKITGLTTDLASKEPTINGGTTSQYWRGDKSWQALNTSAVAEGSNQYFTPARAISSLSSSAPITYSTVTGTIGISQASGSGNGYLASSDWSTFNAKQNALGYTAMNKAGDTMSGALDLASNDINSAGNVQIAAARTLGLGVYATDPAGLTSSEKGKTWFNSTANQIKYWDGSTVQTVGAVGAAVSSLNGQAGASQTFGAPGTAGTAPSWTSSGNVHTINIPLASAASVSAGLLSNTDYAAFSAKQPAGSYITSLTGDITTSGFSGGSATATLPNVVTGGTSTKVTYDGKGRVTAGTSLGSSDIPPLSASIISSGTLPVAFGGTGATSLAANSVVLGNGTGALQTVAPGMNGTVLTSNGTTWTSAVIPATNWASPGAIGSITPNSASFTTLQTSGNVGIGTTAPSATLDVESASTDATTMTLGNSSGTHQYQLAVTGSAHSYGSGYLTFWDQTVGATRMIVSPAGNVGIGTTAPANKLEVAGTIKSTSGGIIFPDGTTQTSAAVNAGTNNSIISSFPDYIVCTISNAGKMLLPLMSAPHSNGNYYYIKTSNGYWQVGFTSAGASLGAAYYSVASVTSDCDNQSIAQLYAAGKAFNIAKGPAAQWLQNGTAGYYNAGNVGIGTTAPSSQLHVAATLPNSGPEMKIENLSATTASAGYRLKNTVRNWGLFVRGDASNILAFQDDTASAIRMAIDSSGNVGIGSNAPTAKLDVAGDLKVSGKYFGSKSGVGYVQPANWSYSFGGAGTTGATLWSENITVPQDSIIQVTLNGHWQVTTGSCYLSVGIDDVSVDYPCTAANSSCYGWAHTYSTVWENMSHSGYAKISAGTHKISVMGFTYNNTCYLNGARISYMYFPQ